MTSLALQFVLGHVLPRRHVANAAGSPTGPFTLAHGALRRLALPRGQALECLHGSLWITVDGDARDHVMEPGDRYQPPDGAGIVVYALEDAAAQTCAGGR